MTIILTEPVNYIVTTSEGLPQQRQSQSSAEIAAFTDFAAELVRGVGASPKPYDLNRARLALADHHALVRLSVPIRQRRTLDETYNRFYAELFDLHLSQSQPDFSAPMPAPPPPEPTQKPTTHAEALEALYESF